MKQSPTLSFFFILIALLGTFIWACGQGYMKITPSEILHILSGSFIKASSALDMNATTSIVVLDVRLPRILCAMMVGGSLAVAGCVFQAVLLNPLADPYTLGVSSGAAFGAALSIVFTLIGLAPPSQFLIPLLAFAGALTTLFFVFFIASSDKDFSSNTLILAGVIVAAILSSGIGFLKYLADEQVNTIVFWLMGSFSGKTWSEAQFITFISTPLLFLLYYFASDMNILSFGSKTANSLGINVVRTRKTLLITASLITAASVSISGIIGFIGLIVPHLMRRIVGANNKILIPISFLSGALLLLIADTTTRAILPNEVPIGILTALIGGPFFCYIFVRRHRRKR